MLLGILDNFLVDGKRSRNSIKKKVGKTCIVVHSVCQGFFGIWLTNLIQKQKKTFLDMSALRVAGIQKNCENILCI